MKDGSLRLFNLLPSGNTNPQHRYGHELTRFETVDNSCLLMHVEISDDGNYVSLYEICFICTIKQCMFITFFVFLFL